MELNPNLLRIARIEKKMWTQQKAAHELSVAIKVYQEWEYGNRKPMLSNKKKLLEIFGKEIFNGDDK